MLPIEFAVIGKLLVRYQAVCRKLDSSLLARDWPVCEILQTELRGIEASMAAVVNPARELPPPPPPDRDYVIGGNA